MPFAPCFEVNLYFCGEKVYQNLTAFLNLKNSKILKKLNCEIPLGFDLSKQSD